MKYFLAALTITFLCGGCCSGPVEVDRSNSPYLHTNFIESVVYRPAPRPADADSSLTDTTPITFTDKDQIRCIVFWLNETFHNRNAFTCAEAAVSQSGHVVEPLDKLEILTSYTKIEIQLGTWGAYEKKKLFVLNKNAHTDLQNLIDDRYPDDMYCYVDTVVVLYGNYYYFTYFYPKLLARTDVAGN